ncbi:hypothetical protein [Caldalkalibacillus salinus]|uniref:hypothetical protein n=1 Tax=Caldalkalibacillus salinus TaxID=2803787 RepID=UPI0019211C67|nr:hypothetical protein [Caldalkalibacillus salinus]
MMRFIGDQARQILGKTVLTTALLFGTCLGGAVQAEEEADFTEQLMEWEAAGIDANHTATIENLRAYIDANIDPGTFAGLHIDRDERLLGTIVLSFTEEVSEETKQDMEALLSENARLQIRIVDYTEQDLMAKQEEINKVFINDDGYITEDIKMDHAGVDMINNVVEIGIRPFNEETAQVVYDRFGDEMINVVEGHALTPFDAAEGVAEASAGGGLEAELPKEAVPMPMEKQTQGVFQQMMTWFLSWFD